MKKLVVGLVITALCATLMPGMAMAAPKKPVIGLELKVRDVILYTASSAQKRNAERP